MNAVFTRQSFFKEIYEAAYSRLGQCPQ